MKLKSIITLIIIGLMCISTGYTAQNKEFLQKMKSKMKKVKVRDKFKTTNAVGGVRANENDKDTKSLYWAGKSSVTQAEYEMFSKCLNAAESGNSADAIPLFKQFLKDYPVSIFAEDVHGYIKSSSIQ